MLGLSGDERIFTIGLAVLTQYMVVTNGQTVKRTDGQYSLY